MGFFWYFRTEKLAIIDPILSEMQIPCQTPKWHFSRVVVHFRQNGPFWPFWALFGVFLSSTVLGDFSGDFSEKISTDHHFFENLARFLAINLIFKIWPQIFKIVFFFSFLIFGHRQIYPEKSPEKSWASPWFFEIWDQIFVKKPRIFQDLPHFKKDDRLPVSTGGFWARWNELFSTSKRQLIFTIILRFPGDFSWKSLNFLNFDKFSILTCINTG